MNNSFRKAHMITHKIKDPRPIDIKLMTQFKNNNQSQSNIQQILAQFVLYTQESVYIGELKKYEINSQLSWNQNCINALVDSLSGKKANIEIKFDEVKLELSLICQIESGINIKMFQIHLVKEPKFKPMQHMRETFMSYKNIYFQQETKIKQEKQRILQEIKEMQALQKQIQEQTVTQISHLKKNFIDVINACKKQLRKYMKTGINQIVNEQQEQEDEEIKKRPKFRVNREAIVPTQAKHVQKENHESVVDNDEQYYGDGDNLRLQDIF